MDTSDVTPQGVLAEFSMVTLVDNGGWEGEGP